MKLSCMLEGLHRVHTNLVPVKYFFGLFDGCGITPSQDTRNTKRLRSPFGLRIRQVFLY